MHARRWRFEAEKGEYPMMRQSEILQGYRVFGVRRTVFAALMFIAAYFTTITVNAQADVIQLGQNKAAVVTGSVVRADENFVIIDSAGKQMKIVLDDVDLQGEADTLFSPGMIVSADGRITGDDFGMPIFEAKNITATEAPAGDVPPAP